eukprot:6187011-Pleurochrysis_carterae.AAC.3
MCVAVCIQFNSASGLTAAVRLRMPISMHEAALTIALPVPLHRAHEPRRTHRRARPVAPRASPGQSRPCAPRHVARVRPSLLAQAYLFAWQ